MCLAIHRFLHYSLFVPVCTKILSLFGFISIEMPFFDKSERISASCYVLSIVFNRLRVSSQSACAGLKICYKQGMLDNFIGS